MHKIKKQGIIFIILVATTLIIGCSTNTISENAESPDFDILEMIKIEVIEESILPDGVGYAMTLKNESEYVIVQNNVYISYPIANADRTQFKTSKWKVETVGNETNIGSGNEVTLSIFMPNEYYKDNENICPDMPEIEIQGYINKLDAMNRFTFIGSINAFDSKFKSKQEKCE